MLPISTEAKPVVTPVKATLRLPQIVALYIGAVLGSGILIVPGLAADIAGPASLLAWGLMTVLVLPMALTMGLLSARYPHAGGVAFFVATAFNPPLGALVGWFFLMSVTVGAPVLALTGAGYLSVAFGWGGLARQMIAVAILAAGLLANYWGVKMTGRLQVAVVSITVLVLAATIAGGIGRVDLANLTPTLPNGWANVGHAATLLYWCFIGWEAVAHWSAEFRNPERNAISGTVIAAGVIGILYFLTAWVVVGTHSYGPGVSDTSLIPLIKGTFGNGGAVLAGFAALFVCLAPAIAYIGAAARLACALATGGFAPQSLARLSPTRHTPMGGLCFLAVGFAVLLLVFSTGMVSLKTLIQIPNATFILTYLGGCAAGIKLLKGNPFGVAVSTVSLAVTAIIFLFVGWAVWSPAVIAAVWYGYRTRSQRAIPGDT